MTTSDIIEKFWTSFKDKDFSKAQVEYEQLSQEAKQKILAHLYQQSQYHRKPIMVSVLRGNLYEGKTFNDFYHAWMPDEAGADLSQYGETYKQIFPVPVRVINGINTANQDEIISIGITWVENKEDESAFWDYINNAKQAEDEVNKSRHDKIQDVADRELLGLFKIESDDNLGTPF